MTADLPAGLDNGHAIPEMREANLSVKDLQQLFADLEARTRILGVHEKVGRTEHSGPSVVDLDDVRTRLIAVTLPAAQIRCAFDVHEWTDTLIATREGMRLVRC